MAGLESDFEECFQRGTNITLIKGKGCSYRLFRVCLLSVCREEIAELAGESSSSVSWPKFQPLPTTILCK